ncbi:MAG: YggS family pyridoxal phosphate-dependent enzyme [Bacteroidaceae bacterium]|nr:YggS family pyridoxal phosphate-dependent enzyme [Bacteroidaceae bacterium]
MPDIRKNIEAIRATLPNRVTLIAVSKYHPIESIEEAYSAGQRDFGESKAQDLRIKQQSLPKDIKWHFIGHLQSNKIKYIASFIHLIHSIDSLHLLQEVDRHAEKNQRVISCLLQIHIAEEESKFGFSPEECLNMLEEGEWRNLKHIQIRGLMCMASNTNNAIQIKEEFLSVKRLFDIIKDKYFCNEESFNTFSAGMSDDYPIAIEAGSTHIRVGSGIFAK